MPSPSGSPLDSLVWTPSTACLVECLPFRTLRCAAQICRCAAYIRTNLGRRSRGKELQPWQWHLVDVVQVDDGIATAIVLANSSTWDPDCVPNGSPCRPAHGPRHPQRRRVLARGVCIVPLSCVCPVAQPANEQSASRAAQRTSHSSRQPAVDLGSTAQPQYVVRPPTCYVVQLLPDLPRPHFRQWPRPQPGPDSEDMVQCDKDRSYKRAFFPCNVLAL